MTLLQGGTRTLDNVLLDRNEISTVFHCARPTAPRFRKFGRRWAAWRAARDNAFLVREVLGAERQRQLIFASGSLVYGSSSTPHDEDAPLLPLSYALEYHAGEIPLERAAVEGKPALILRFPWILGNGSWFRWFYLEPLKRTGKVPLFGDGENRMMFIGVDDAARIMLRCSRSGLSGGIVNVATPFVMRQREFAVTVAGHFGGRVADFREIFPRGVERAVAEAFTSDIVLRTRHTEIFRDFPFQPPAGIIEKFSL